MPDGRRFQGDEQADGEIPEGNSVELPPQETKVDQAPQGLTIITKRQVPREFYITKKDAENHGYTRGCLGCGSWFHGVGEQPHTAECRERFRKLMSDDARVQLANQKRQRFEEEEQERKRRKEEKREDKARKKKREEEEEETSRKRTCQSSGSSDGVVLGHGSKRKMKDDLGDDQMQVETEEIAEVEVQRWMNVMLVEERELDPEKVKEARLEEVQFMQKKRLWDVVPWPKDGCPVSLRWVDVVKGDGSTRSRLVARDFKGLDRHRDDFFAATPIGSCKGRIEYGSHEEQQRSSEESHDHRCQESTLESALQGGRLHRVTTRSRCRAGSVWQAQLLVVRIPQGGVGVGRLLC